MKPSIPQGTRDFDAVTVRKRQYILNSIKDVFELNGYQPLETPAMENMETLMGKYGEEGDKLIFKIINNGLSDPKNIEKAKLAFENILQGKSDRNLSERALRYDLTIPFARYVTMNFNQLPIPFKRYQIQPVWRADRPQKGRYREFFQCDADVVGSKSLLNEIELIQIYASVFGRLGVEVAIKVNNRKILAALAIICGGADKMSEITVAIDKLDKIGIKKVKEELAERGLSKEQIISIESFLLITGSNEEKLASLRNLFANNETGLTGVSELEYILNNSQAVNIKSPLILDPTLARGLNYYTGSILEVKAIRVQMGSIGGGGRYDDLTGLFGVPHVPGVGISFGVDRIYDVMEELDLFPKELHAAAQVLFFNLGEKEILKSLELAQQLRSNGIRCEVYPDNVKFDKQFKYADKKAIPNVAILGSKELQSGVVNIKNLSTGVQTAVPFERLTQFEF